MIAPLVVSFFTPEYSREAEDFVEAAALHGYEVCVEPRESLHTWRLNCGMKPRFILEMLAFKNRPVLWVDIDARFRAPWDLGELAYRADFACWFIPYERMRRCDIPGGPHHRRDGLASGTMFFNNTPDARGLLDAWIAQDYGQHLYEQIVLGEAWYDHRPIALRTERLQQRYCKVSDSDYFAPAAGPVVIEHTQASRRLRSLVT